MRAVYFGFATFSGLLALIPSGDPKAYASAGLALMAGLGVIFALSSRP
jgi:hypothetical protein